MTRYSAGGIISIEMDFGQIFSYINVFLAGAGALMVLARGYKNPFYLFGQFLMLCLFGLALCPSDWLLARSCLVLAINWLIYLQAIFLFSKFWRRLPWLILFSLASGVCFFGAFSQSGFSLELMTGLSLLILVAAGFEFWRGGKTGQNLDRLISGHYGLVLSALALVGISGWWPISPVWSLARQLMLLAAIIILADTLVSLPYLQNPLSRVGSGLTWLAERSRLRPAATGPGLTGLGRTLVFGRGWQKSLAAVLAMIIKKNSLKNGLIMLRQGKNEETLRTVALQNLPKDFQELTLPVKNPLGQYLLDRRRTVVAEFLPWEEKRAGSAQVLAEQFSFLRFATAVPIINRDQLDGLILLGDQTNRQVFSRAQLAELEVLAEKISWLLEGARLEASKMLEFERIFTLTGELAKAYAAIREKNEALAQTQQKLDSLAAEMTTAVKAIQDGDNLVARYQVLSQQMVGLSSERDKREKELASLKKEREAFKAEIEGLTETNRRLLTSTEGFATVSRELYEATKKTSEAKNYLENLLSRIDNGVIGVNQEGKISTFNHAMEEIAGLRSPDVLGQNFAEVLADSLKHFLEIENMVNSVLTGAKVSRTQIETTAVTKNEKIPVSISCGPLKDLEGQIIGAIIVVDNLSERKQLDEAIAARSKLESVSEMAVSLNHEINNPLTSVLCNIQYVLNKLAPQKDLIEQNLIDGLVSAEKESKRIKKILENIRRITIPVVEEYLPGTKMISFGKSVYGRAKEEILAKAKKSRKKEAGPTANSSEPESDRSAGAGLPSSEASE